MNWIKASDFKWEPRKTYYAKWPDPDFIDIKGSGRFQESDGTFFWDTQGIVPVLKSKHHELLIIDEQDEGWVLVEKLKQQIIDDLLGNEQLADRPFVHSGHNTYTRRQLAEELKNNTLKGMELISGAILLAIDLMGRNKIPPFPPATKD